MATGSVAATPALVMPLTKRSAQSSRRRRRGVRRRRRRGTGRRRHPRGWGACRADRRRGSGCRGPGWRADAAGGGRIKPAGAGRRTWWLLASTTNRARNSPGLAAVTGGDAGFVAGHRPRDRGDFAVVEIVHALAHRLANQVMVEIGPIPVGVGDFVTGAGGDDQLVGAIGGGGERVTCAVTVEGEAAFGTPQAASGWVRRGSPLGERGELRKIIARGASRARAGRRAAWRIRQ